MVWMCTETSNRFFMCDGWQEFITNALDRSYKKSIECSRSGLKANIDLIAVCGKQNLAICGHTDSQSNFSALLEYQARGDADLRAYVQLAPGNANYCSHCIQNEFIELCGSQSLNDTLDKCRKANYCRRDSQNQQHWTSSFSCALRRLYCGCCTAEKEEDIIQWFYTVFLHW